MPSPAARRLVKRMNEKYQPKPDTLYGTVVGTTPGGGAQTPFVNVLTEEGVLLQQAANGGYNLAGGTKVEIEGVGKAGNGRYSIKRPVAQTTQQAGTNINATLETPSIARVLVSFHSIQNGNYVQKFRLAIWQIQAQWRYGRAVGYEIQIRKNTDTAAASYVLAPRRQIGADLAEDLSAGDLTTINLAPIEGEGAPSSDFPPFGVIDILGEFINHDTEGVNSVSGLERGVATPDGDPTNDVNHFEGDFVRGRTVYFDTLDLQPGLTYEYRIRATSDGQTSGYSDWEMAIIPNELPVPDWATPPTPTYSERNGSAQIQWTPVDLNLQFLDHYQVSTADNAAFTSDTRVDIGNTSRFTLAIPIATVVYFRVRPVNINGDAGAWSQSVRITSRRDIPDGRPIANRVTDGDFASIGSLASWTASTALTENFDSDRGFSALGCLQYEFVRNGGHGGQVSETQVISGLTVGQKYHAVAYVCRESNFNQTGDAVHLAVTAGDTAHSPEYPYASIPIKDTGDWLLLECEGIVTSGTTATFRVYAEIATTPAVVSFIYLDDCQLYITGAKT